MATKTLTPLRPVAEQVRELSNAIRSERERDEARPGDKARNCKHYEGMLSARYGHCNATPHWAGVHPLSDCPQTCQCFRGRA
jgi:hypothetical protein